MRPENQPPPASLLNPTKPSHITDNDAKREEPRKAEEIQSKYARVTFKSFLEETPPDTRVEVIDLTLTYDGREIRSPEITLICENETCGGPRIFTPQGNTSFDQTWRFLFLSYCCRNCNFRSIHFAVAIQVTNYPKAGIDGTATCVKVGQFPACGPQTSSRLLSLIGPDRDLFLQGRRAENRGLGIGAFAYYRRVVENQKNRIIAEIAKVAKLSGGTPETDARFAAAIKESRFSESLAMVRDVIPQTLMISGQNPLTLLHSALSKGLHNPDMTDAHCLQLAQSVRTILAELAERASEALKNNREIQSALSILMAVPSSPKSTSEKVGPSPSDTESSSRK